MFRETPIPAAPAVPPVSGIGESVRETLRTASRFAALRLSLLTAEAAEAAGHFRRVALVAAAAGIGTGMAWFGACAALVLWIAQRWCGGNAVPPLLGLTLLHLLAAAAAVLWLVKRGRHPGLFAASREEFAEDRKWLNS